MSKHFTKGTVSGAYADTGPGTITVDRDATVHAMVPATDALLLAGGAWTVKLKGAVRADDGNAF